VADVRTETQDRDGPAARLWRNAPLWRAAIVGASVLTVATAILWVESHLTDSQGESGNAPEELVRPVAANRQNPAAHRSLDSPEPAQRDVRPATNVADAGAVSEEEEQILATCHPHLLRAPTMPQIDVANVPEPNLGHIKMHFWVNGAGTVTRETVTSASLGTSGERQAEAEFAKQLTFSLPNTKDCRSREVEVIGDFFEQRGPSGQWATFVRLYPRLSFSSNGTLERAE